MTISKDFGVWQIVCLTDASIGRLAEIYRDENAGRMYPDSLGDHEEENASVE